MKKPSLLLKANNHHIPAATTPEAQRFVAYQRIYINAQPEEAEPVEPADETNPGLGGIRAAAAKKAKYGKGTMSAAALASARSQAPPVDAASNGNQPPIKKD